MRNEQKVKVDVDNSRVKVAGRSYEASHVLIVSARSIEAAIEPGSIRVRAYFDTFPEVESQGEDLVVVSRSGGRFEVDAYGEKIKSVEESGDVIKLKGDIISLKFELDNEYVVLKLPAKGRVKGSKLMISGEGDVSMNIIVMPFTVGIITARKADCEIRLKGDVVEAKVEHG